MPEFASSTVVILLASISGLLLFLMVLVIGIGRCLSRIERRLAEEGTRSVAADPAPAHGESGAFEAFLKEDPARRKLPKSEQFAEYRRWRQEKGMNWTNS